MNKHRHKPVYNYSYTRGGGGGGDGGEMELNEENKTGSLVERLSEQLVFMLDRVGRNNCHSNSYWCWIGSNNAWAQLGSRSVAQATVRDAHTRAKPSAAVSAPGQTHQIKNKVWVSVHDTRHISSSKLADWVKKKEKRDKRVCLDVTCWHNYVVSFITVRSV